MAPRCEAPRSLLAVAFYPFSLAALPPLWFATGRLRWRCVRLKPSNIGLNPKRDLLSETAMRGFAWAKRSSTGHATQEHQSYSSPALAFWWGTDERLPRTRTLLHPEGVKGARAVALAVFKARIGDSKDEIRDSISNECAYDLAH
jgi:hypothetical protein